MSRTMFFIIHKDTCSHFKNIFQTIFLWVSSILLLSLRWNKSCLFYGDLFVIFIIIANIKPTFFTNIVFIGLLPLLDQVKCENPHWKIFISDKYSLLKNIHPWKIFTPEKYPPLKNIHPWKISTPDKYSPLKNIHPWEILTPGKIFTPKNVHPWKIFTPESIHPRKYSPQKLFTPNKHSPKKIFTPGKYSPHEKYSAL